jgi:hypothetical protein
MATVYGIVKRSGAAWPCAPIFEAIPIRQCGKPAFGGDRLVNAREPLRYLTESAPRSLP